VLTVAATHFSFGLGCLQGENVRDHKFRNDFKYNEGQQPWNLNRPEDGIVPLDVDTEVVSPVTHHK
jgi:hypothetical protein